MKYTDLTATAKEQAIKNYLIDYCYPDYYDGNEMINNISLKDIEYAIMENGIQFTENGNILD